MRLEFLPPVQELDIFRSCSSCDDDGAGGGRVLGLGALRFLTPTADRDVTEDAALGPVSTATPAEMARLGEVMDKVDKRLAGWKSNLLSIA